jgi:hypothetical protein
MQLFGTHFESGKFVGYQNTNIGLKISWPTWCLVQTLVAILDFQFACVTRLQATLKLTFYCNCNDSPNVIIGILKVNLLVKRNTRGSLPIIVSVHIVDMLEVLYIENVVASL